MFHILVVLAFFGLVWLAASNYALRVQCRRDQEAISIQKRIIEMQREQNREQERKLTSIWKLFSDKDSLGV